jgi:hypothetical protein
MNTPANPKQTPLVLEHTIRLLYPFWLDTGTASLNKAVEALGQLRHLREQQAPQKTWREPLKLPTRYSALRHPSIVRLSPWR